MLNARIQPRRPTLTRRDEMRFSERVAIVTGGASGIGLATAKRFAAEGARVVIADLHQDKADAAANELRRAGAPDAFGFACDVAAEDQVEQVVAKTYERFGRLDVIVNNAGLMVFKAIEDLNTDDWLGVLRVDLLGAFYFTKQAFLRMKHGGAIV